MEEDTGFKYNVNDKHLQSLIITISQENVRCAHFCSSECSTPIEKCACALMGCALINTEWSWLLQSYLMQK